MPLKIAPLAIPEVLVIETGLIRDERGFFAETYSAKVLETNGFRATFLQDNLSSSRKGVLRGLHYQLEPHGMGKLVRVLSGAAFDVAVDIRRGSPTFGKWVARTLTLENREALWIPPGFAHGFLALEDSTTLLYKCTTTHTPEAERAMNYADPAIGIEWPIRPTLVAAKDAAAPPLASAEYNFSYEPRSPQLEQ
ncbi:MAG TPA: dTDP-4-dehydrorhamnose 3,5-epimerase [Polyangiaceae bacterium]|nr:dTDP-4-dehydrorhamnose 3,5-epimerase [Polyangiaceae bacterium]